MTKKAKVYYFLDEEGRKKSLLAGGNGKEVQVFETDVTEALLKKGSVHEDGSVKVVFGATANAIGYAGDFRKNDGYLYGTDISMAPVEPKLTKTFVSIFYTDSLGIEHQSRYRDDGLTEYFVKEGFIEKQKKIKYFDKPMTLEELIKWDDERLSSLEVKEKELEVILAEKTKELEKELENMQKEIEKHNEEQTQRFIEKVENQIAQEKAKKAEKAKSESEKANWIKENGSELLQKTYSLGYECQRLYALERAEKEFPEYILDFNNTGDFDERIGPSMEELEELERLLNEGHSAKIVWLTYEPTNHIASDDVEDKDDYDYYHEDNENNYKLDNPTAAIRITGFLGKYDLYKKF